MLRTSFCDREQGLLCVCLAQLESLRVIPVVVQGGEQAEQLMQASKVVSPAEEAGYQMPDARQHPYRYIPPGFIIQSSGRDACPSTLSRAAEG